MKDFTTAFAVITASAALGIGLCYPIQAGLNHVAVVMCKNNPEKGLIHYKDTVFPGQEKIACVPRKYI